MKGRYILPLFAAVFIAGNLTAEQICGFPDECRMPAAGIGATAILLITVLLQISASVKPKLKSAIYFAVAFACGMAGVAAQYFFRPDTASLPLQDGRTMDIEAVITDFGQTRKGDRYLKAEASGERTHIYNIPQDLECHVGDTIRTTVRVASVKNFTPEFDYEKFMAKKGIRHTCFVKRNTATAVLPCTVLSPGLAAARQREKFSAALDGLFPLERQKETKAVIKALTFGYRDEISGDTKEAFRKSGAMHLLALSGMHLGIIYAVMSGILSLLLHHKRLKKLRSVVLLCILWSYTVFTGCGMSLLRAMVMVTVYETANLLDRQRNGLCSLALSVLLITVFNPSAPSDTGFQLSCCAMLGILLLVPFLQRIFPSKNSILCKFRDICAVGLSCQIFTAPLIFLNFGTFATFSLFAGILCSPLTSLTIMLTPLSFIDSVCFSFIGKLCTTALEYTVNLILSINNTISAI